MYLANNITFEPRSRYRENPLAAVRLQEMLGFRPFPNEKKPEIDVLSTR